MQINVLDLLNKVYQSIYCYALYFEEQKQENIAESFFSNAKLLEKVIEELKEDNPKTQYIVYPVFYYEDKFEKLEHSFIFDNEKEAEDFLSLAQKKYTTLIESDCILKGWTWEMRKILTDNSRERLEKLAKDKEMIKSEVALEREWAEIEEFFDFLVLDYDRGANYDENFLEYIKKDIDAGIWDEYMEREVCKKYDVLRIFEDIVNNNDGYMIDVKELETYKKDNG